MAPTTLTVVSSGLEAEELCGLLRVNGINCTYRQTSVASGITASTGLVGPTEVIVDQSDLERAQELLAAPLEDDEGT